MRVGDTPVVINRQGTTRILLRDSIVWVPSPAQRPKDDGRHTDAGGRSFAHVYVNELARAAWTSKRRMDYPVGSVLVREKLRAPDAAEPEVLAVMIKRARGFNHKSGDWEFLTVDGALTKARAPEKKDGCLDCHASRSPSDYVYPLPTPGKKQ